MPLTHRTKEFRITHTIENHGMLQKFANAVYEFFKVRKYQCLSYPNLTNATTAGYAKTQNTTVYAINGEIYSKAATDNLFDCTGITTSSTGYAKVLFMLGSDGSAYTLKGQESTAQETAPWPKTTANKCAIGGVELGNSYAGGSLSGKTFHNFIFNPADDVLKLTI